MSALTKWRGMSRKRRALIGVGVFTVLAAVFMSSKAGAIVRLARAQVGLREIPVGSNGGPEISKFSGGRPESWCAHFVAWVFRNAGHPLPFDQEPTPNRAVPLASVSFFMQMAKDQGRFLPPGSVPKPGYVIFYPSHTGIVVGFDGSRDRVETVEGNFSDKVVNTTVPRTSSSIKGYGVFV